MRGIKQHFLQRYWFVLGVLFVVIFVIVLRLLLISQTTVLEKQGYAQTTKSLSFTHDRGKIFDRNGNTIAGNIITANIVINPQNIYIPGLNNVISVWKLSSKYQKKKNTYLSEVIRTNDITKYEKHITPFDMLTFIRSFNLLQSNINERIVSYQEQCITQNKCDKYHILTKKENILSDNVKKLSAFKKEKFLVCSRTKQRLNMFQSFLELFNDIEAKYALICKKIKDNAFHFEYRPKRIYPFSPSTTPSIGALNYQHKGVFGLESTYENYLQHSRNIKQISRPIGSHAPYYDIDLSQNNKNNDITLTLDNTIQFYLYDAIAEAVKKFKAKSGSGIILNPKGEILAMVSYPTNDVNQYISSNSEYYLNRVLTDNLEIASTIKPLLTLALLNEKKISLEEVIHFTRDETKGYTHYDSLSVNQIIEKSYTPGSIKITKRLNNKTLYNYLTLFGFNQSTDVLPNIENSGFLKDLYSWSESYTEILSYGYGISATLAQLARAYLVFANDGVIKNLKLLLHTKPIEYQVADASNVQQMIPALKSVVETGTAKRAQLDFHQALGKTGSARLLINGKYVKNRTNAFFVGLAPSEDIKYIMAVVINDPISDISRDGGYISTPIFKKVMDNILK